MAASTAIAITSDGDGVAQPTASAIEFAPVAFEPWFFKDSQAKEYSVKWNLDKYLSMGKFSFSGPFPTEAKAQQDWFVSLFNSEALRGTVGVAGSSGGQAKLTGTVTAATATPLKATVTSMTFFDVLVSEGLVSETGYIRKCVDNVVQGCTVSDLLRDSFINEDSEHSWVWDDDAREEAVWALMRAIVTGGSMCQYEDSWGGYLEAAKHSYKDMVKVFKNSNTGAIEVASLAFTVSALSGASLFPDDNPHNLCLVCVDPTSRTATVWYSAFVPFW